MTTDQTRIARMNAPAGRIRLVIDTDAKNEVDDQFAIAWAIASPDRFQVEAIYAVPFSHDCFRQFNRSEQLLSAASSLNGHSENPSDGMAQSAEEARRILSLMGAGDIPVFHGSSGYLPARRAPVESEAARDLVRRAMATKEPLYVAAIGAATNIASALLIEPEIARHVTVVWLGGHALALGHGIEFNLIQDVWAAQVLFDSGVPMIWIPCINTASHLTVSEAELEKYLLGHGPVSDYLAKTVLEKFRDPDADIALMSLLRTSSLRDQSDQSEEYLSQFPTRHVAPSRVIWDVATIAALKNPNWTPSRLIPSPRLSNDFRWRQMDPSRPAIRLVTYCHRNMIFGDLFASLDGK